MTIKNWTEKVYVANIEISADDIENILIAFDPDELTDLLCEIINRNDIVRAAVEAWLERTKAEGQP